MWTMNAEEEYALHRLPHQIKHNCSIVATTVRDARGERAEVARKKKEGYKGTSSHRAVVTTTVLGISLRSERLSFIFLATPPLRNEMRATEQNSILLPCDGSRTISAWTW
jgi:hypothetical protein